MKVLRCFLLLVVIVVCFFAARTIVLTTQAGVYYKDVRIHCYLSFIASTQHDTLTAKKEYDIATELKYKGDSIYNKINPFKP